MGQIKYAFGRIIKVRLNILYEWVLEGETTGAGVISAVELDNLDMAFTCTRNMGKDPNTAELIVYNASDATVNDMMAEEAYIEIEVGYLMHPEPEVGKPLGDPVESTGVIYTGNIIDVVDDCSGVDRKTTLKCMTVGKGAAAITSTKLSFIVPAGEQIETPIRKFAQLLGLALDGEAFIKGIVLKEGLEIIGETSSNILQQIREELTLSGVTLTIDNDKLIFLKAGEPIKTSVAYLAPESGLLWVKRKKKSKKQQKLDATQVGTGADTDTAKKQEVIEFESIMNYTLEPNRAVQIVGRKVQGLYTMSSLTFRGDNMGGEFNVTGEAIA